MRKVGIIVLRGCPWLVAGLLCLQAIGCSSKPNSLESRVAFFKENREVFDSYVPRLERGEVKSSKGGYALPQLFIDNDIKEAARGDGCIEITFWFMPTDAVPLFIYSPRGLEGVPEKYRNGGRAGCNKWAYWKFVAIDEHWFYCEWDM